MTAMTHIETVTVGSGGVASITFSAIAGDFTDLLIVTSFRSSRVNGFDQTLLSLNSSTSGFTTRVLQGTGSSVGSFLESREIGHMSAASNTANTFANQSLYIPNYASSANKSLSADSVSENNATAAYQMISAIIWANTDAITSVTLEPYLGDFVEHSSASLFGIAAGSDGIVAVS